MLSTFARQFCRNPASNLFKPFKWSYTNNSQAQSYRINISSLCSRGNSFKSPQVASIRKTTTAAADHVKVEISPEKAGKAVGWWLLGCSGMVLGSVILGNITRLTETGLSTTTWKVLGEKIPASQQEWEREFKYFQQLPEFKLKNRDMTLSEFKFIWHMERACRWWGRVLGFAFLWPASYFWWKGVLPAAIQKRVIFLGPLILLQNQVGWHIAQPGSGNRWNASNEIPKVSPYLLAGHLGMNLVVYSSMLRSALGCLLPAKELPASALADSAAVTRARLFLKMAHACKGLVFFTVFSGTLVSALGAGLVYNSFPKMGENWIPDDIFDLSPTFKNFFENPTTTQFNHRLLGEASVALISIMWILSRRTKLPPRAYTAATAFVAMAWLQASVGITSLLHHVPLPEAVSHQTGSFLLLSSAIWLSHEIKYLRYLK